MKEWRKTKRTKTPTIQDSLFSAMTPPYHVTTPFTSDLKTPHPMALQESWPSISSIARRVKKWWDAWARESLGMGTQST